MIRLQYKDNFFINIILLPILSGVLYGLSWTYSSLFLFQIIALVPFFISVNAIRNSNKKWLTKLGNLALSIILFRLLLEILIMPWIFEISTYVLIVLLVSETFFLIIGLSIMLWKKFPFYGIVFIFILYELILQKTTTLFPVYQIGYAWGNFPSLIQYYSFLGIEGGSAIIILVNLGFYQWWKNRKIGRYSKIIFATFIGLTLISVGKYFFSSPIKLSSKDTISIMHTHIFPADSSYRLHPTKLVDSISRIASPNSLVILPEVFFNAFGWLRTLDNNTLVDHIDSVEKKTNQTFLTGAYLLGVTENPTPQSRYSKKYNVYYNTYNTSLLIDKAGVHLKSKTHFLPFYEYIPNNPIAQWINQFITQIGDGRKVTPLHRQTFFTYRGLKLNVLLCYESIYPMLVAKRAKHNQFLTIHANENWNPSKLLSDEYLKTNRANAIQVGLPIYRTSNYGYSAVIYPKGKMTALYKTNKSFTLLKAKLPANKKGTPSFYVKHLIGYTYWISGIGLFLLILQSFFSFFIPSPKKKH